MYNFEVSNYLLPPGSSGDRREQTEGRASGNLIRARAIPEHATHQHQGLKGIRRKQRQVLQCLEGPDSLKVILSQSSLLLCGLPRWRSGVEKTKKQLTFQKTTTTTTKLTFQSRRRRRPRFDPWVGKIPWIRNGNPLQYSCLEKSVDREAWWAIQFMGLQRVRHVGATEHVPKHWKRGNALVTGPWCW